MSSSALSIQEKVDIMMSICEESQNSEKLVDVLSKPSFTVYNGFEPSGRIHIAQALITTINANKIIKCGGTMIIYIADYFAKLNHKMNGDINKIREVGRYFIEVFKCCGMNMEHVKIIWASDFIHQNFTKYFETMMNISEFATLNRIKRCCPAMGRNESDALSASQILYPCMQCTDVLTLDDGVDICQLGVDQRKVNMLAIEYAQHNNLKVPIVLSHHMLMNLKGKGKMSKSDPNCAIFVDDEKEDVERKIRKAYCPPTFTDNPIIEYIQYLILPIKNNIVINNVIYSSINEIEEHFDEIIQEPLILKQSVADSINEIIEPIRSHFRNGEMKELLDKIKSWRK